MGGARVLMGDGAPKLFLMGDGGLWIILKGDGDGSVRGCAGSPKPDSPRSAFTGFCKRRYLKYHDVVLVFSHA